MLKRSLVSLCDFASEPLKRRFFCVFAGLCEAFFRRICNAGVVFLRRLRNIFLKMERPPPGEYEQNWDTTMDLTLRRFVYGSLSGGASALLFFRSPATRWAAVAFGAGVGIGSALTDASQLFRGTIQASLPSVSSPNPNPAAIAVPEAPSAPELPPHFEAPKLARFEEPLVQEAQET